MRTTTEVFICLLLALSTLSLVFHLIPLQPSATSRDTLGCLSSKGTLPVLRQHVNQRSPIDVFTAALYTNYDTTELVAATYTAQNATESKNHEPCILNSSSEGTMTTAQRLIRPLTDRSCRCPRRTTLRRLKSNRAMTQRTSSSIPIMVSEPSSSIAPKNSIPSTPQWHAK